MTTRISNNIMVKIFENYLHFVQNFMIDSSDYCLYFSIKFPLVWHGGPIQLILQESSRRNGPWGNVW